MVQGSSTTGQGNRSQPQFGYPRSRLDDAAREITGDFVLVEPSTGKIWSSFSQHDDMTKALRDTVENLQPVT